MFVPKKNLSKFCILPKSPFILTSGVRDALQFWTEFTGSMKPEAASALLSYVYDGCEAKFDDVKFTTTIEPGGQKLKQQLTPTKPQYALLFHHFLCSQV